MNSENLHYSGVYTEAMGFTSDACWFLLIKTLLIKNNKKGETVLKIEAGVDEKHVFFFTWPNLLTFNISQISSNNSEKLSLLANKHLWTFLSHSSYASSRM